MVNANASDLFVVAVIFSPSHVLYAAVNGTQKKTVATVAEATIFPGDTVEAAVKHYTTVFENGAKMSGHPGADVVACPYKPKKSRKKLSMPFEA
jgi:hypothetical protein